MRRTSHIVAPSGSRKTIVGSEIARRSILRFARQDGVLYHPVPTVFGRNRELAEAFGAAWARRVGGGKLVYTRSPEGARVLLRERASARLKVRAEALAIWR